GGVAAVGCTGARQTFGLFDGSRRARGPAVLWSDTRGRAGTGPHDQAGEGPVAANLAWVAARRPDVWAAAVRILAPRDLAVWHLTGRAVTDPTLASCTGRIGDGTPGQVPH